MMIPLSACYNTVRVPSVITANVTLLTVRLVTREKCRTRDPVMNLSCHP